MGGETGKGVCSKGLPDLVVPVPDVEGWVGVAADGEVFAVRPAGVLEQALVCVRLCVLRFDGVPAHGAGLVDAAVVVGVLQDAVDEGWVEVRGFYAHGGGGGGVGGAWG